MNEARKARQEYLSPELKERPDQDLPGQELQQVLARIQEDAKREPERYLRDAEVPAGGE